MTAQTKQEYQREPDKNKATAIRLITTFSICTVILIIPAYLYYIKFISNPYTDILNDPNIIAADKTNWAQRIDLPGLPNYHKVSENLYRGAQPTALGIEQLSKLGIKTIINLRSAHSDRDELDDTRLVYEHLNMTTLGPENEDIVRFLQIVTDSNNIPVFVHCKHGADRTGTMCAIYRIAVQNWSKDEAIAEMIRGGFGFHKIWINLVDDIRELDIDKIKKSAEIKE
jgi:protein tyrosine/serine phosphatase